VIESTAADVSIDLVRKFSPEGLSLMEFPDQLAAQISEKLYADHPLLSEKRTAEWNCQINRELHTTDDSHLFTKEQSGYTLYEGKMILAFDHQCSEATHWVAAKEARDYETGRVWSKAVKNGQPPKRLDLDEYRIAFRKVAASTNERTMLATILPQRVITSDSMQVIRRRIPKPSDGSPVELMTSPQALYVASVFDSVACDFILRMKVTINLSAHFILSLPIPRMGCGGARDAWFFWPIVARTLRLVCTAEEYAALWTEVFPQVPADAFTGPAATYGPAHERELRERLAESVRDITATWTLACGLHDRTPERRDTGDRAQTRAELDALIAHLYGLTRTEFVYILDTFPGLRKKEMKSFGEFQSRRKALEEYDRFSK
jgi:hypothetical protein